MCVISCILTYLTTKNKPGNIKFMNQFQLTSLANFYFDIAKAWFVAGVITPFGLPTTSLSQRLILPLAGIITAWFFIQAGLAAGRSIKI